MSSTYFPELHQEAEGSRSSMFTVPGRTDRQLVTKEINFPLSRGGQPTSTPLHQQILQDPGLENDIDAFTEISKLLEISVDGDGDGDDDMKLNDTDDELPPPTQDFVSMEEAERLMTGNDAYAEDDLVSIDPTTLALISSTSDSTVLVDSPGLPLPEGSVVDQGAKNSVSSTKEDSQTSFDQVPDLVEGFEPGQPGQPQPPTPSPPPPDTATTSPPPSLQISTVIEAPKTIDNIGSGGIAPVIQVSESEEIPLENRHRGKKEKKHKKHKKRKKHHHGKEDKDNNNNNNNNINRSVPSEEKEIIPFSFGKEEEAMIPTEEVGVVDEKKSVSHEEITPLTKPEVSSKRVVFFDSDDDQGPTQPKKTTTTTNNNKRRRNRKNGKKKASFFDDEVEVISSEVDSETGKRVSISEDEDERGLDEDLEGFVVDDEIIEYDSDTSGTEMHGIYTGDEEGRNQHRNKTRLDTVIETREFIHRGGGDEKGSELPGHTEIRISDETTGIFDVFDDDDEEGIGGGHNGGLSRLKRNAREGGKRRKEYTNPDDWIMEVIRDPTKNWSSHGTMKNVLKRMLSESSKKYGMVISLTGKDLEYTLKTILSLLQVLLVPETKIKLSECIELQEDGSGPSSSGRSEGYKFLNHQIEPVNDWDKQYQKIPGIATNTASSVMPTGGSGGVVMNDPMFPFTRFLMASDDDDVQKYSYYGPVTIKESGKYRCSLTGGIFHEGDEAYLIQMWSYLNENCKPAYFYVKCGSTEEDKKIYLSQVMVLFGYVTQKSRFVTWISAFVEMYRGNTGQLSSEEVLQTMLLKPPEQSGDVINFVARCLHMYAVNKEFALSCFRPSNEVIDLVDKNDDE